MTEQAETIRTVPEPIDKRWLIKQWVISEWQSGDSPAPSMRVVSSAWGQYHAYDFDTPDGRYVPDEGAAQIVNAVWLTLSADARSKLRPFYFDGENRATRNQFRLAGDFEAAAWSAYERSDGEYGQQFGISSVGAKSRRVVSSRGDSRDVRMRLVESDVESVAE